MDEVPRKELMGSLDELLKCGDYADLTIVNDQNNYRVHKALICPRSKFFRAACGNVFYKEAQDSTITPPDNPQAVKLMIHYFYHLDYPHQPTIDGGFTKYSHDTNFTFGINTAVGSTPKEDERDKNKNKKRASDMPVDATSNLIIHTRLYALGEKYYIDGLKALSLEKFKRECELHWATDDFIRATEEVYSSTVETDRGMRNAVLEVIYSHRKLLDKERVQHLVKDCNALCFDLVMRFHKAPNGAIRKP